MNTLLASADTFAALADAVMSTKRHVAKITEKVGPSSMPSSLLCYEAPKAQLSRSTSATKTRGSRAAPDLAYTSAKVSEVHHDTEIQTSKSIVPDSSTIAEVLDAIFPPKSTEKNGTLYTQKVSRNPATNLDVIALQDRLDQGLQQRQARETGLCPIRSQLYTEAFDEIIRQTTLSNADRGLMLLRVRNEIRMTIASYQVIYESAIAFGMRSALQHEIHKRQLGQDIDVLETEIASLREQMVALTAQAEHLRSEGAALREQDLAQHTADLEELQRIQDTLLRDLEANLATKK
eukprot:m.590661 g.590661  ORF g.590661 m.590661 type:complete len:292 (-) comp22377_c0_seq22:3272-4147(-)